MKKYILTRFAIVFVAVVLLVCFFSIRVNRQLRPLTQAATLSGKVELDTPHQTMLAVVVYTREEGKEEEIVQYRVLSGSGEFKFILPPGHYYVAAFEDSNRDFIYEPWAATGFLDKHPGGSITLEANQVVSDALIHISHQGTAALDFPINLSITAPGSSVTKQQSHLGKVVSLDDEIFDEENGDKGLWRFKEFREEVGGGLFFLEKYDPKKIPVLFIHGYTGTPRDFKYFVERLDRKKFQPWFVYYPSAARMELIAEYLEMALSQLQMTYKFQKIYVVGFSMGGLIGRSLILESVQSHLEKIYKLFISISAPWQGYRPADFSGLVPTEVPSWKDFSEGSEFISSLFAKGLPKDTHFYLLFGYDGDRNPIRPNNDGFITLSSALDLRAQAEAVKVYGFDEDHEDILESEDVSKRLNQILEAGG